MNPYVLLLLRDLLKLGGAFLVTKGITDAQHADSLVTDLVEIIPGVLLFFGGHVASVKQLKKEGEL